MELYNKNLVTCIKTHPYMADVLNKKYDEDFDMDNLDTPSGHITSRIHDGLGRVSHLHSSVNPVQEAGRYAGTLDFSKGSMIIVFGFGLGYHVREIINRAQGDTKVIVVENRPGILFNAMKNVDITDIIQSDRVILIVGDDREIRARVEQVLRTRIFLLSSNLQFFMLPGQAVLLGDSYNRMQREILSVIKNIYFEAGNDVEDTLIGVRQNFANLDEVVQNPGCDRFTGRYEGKPAIIVSAGPSLAKNVDLLREVEGRALILCVDASMKVLMQKGITPDAILSIERGLPTYQLFYENKAVPERSVLVAPPVIRPEIFQSVKGDKIICLKETETINVWLDRLVKKGLINTGTSVAHLAFGFARKLGADPVIFIGQDLAYSPEGYSHSSGTAFEGNRGTMEDADRVTVEGYDGNPIPSTRIWRNFLAWFETQIAGYPNVRFIDATEGGARIKGTGIMSFREAVDTYCKGEISRLWEETGREEIDKTEIKRIYLKVYAEVLRVKREFLRARERCDGYFDSLLKIENEYDLDRCSSKQLERVLRKMRESDHILSDLRKTRLVMFVFQTIFLNTYRKFNQLGREITGENVRENIRIQKYFYGQVAPLSEIVGEVFEEVADGIKERYRDRFL